MDSSPAARAPWPSLWFTAAGSLLAQLALCRFFSFGRSVPFSIDVNPCNLWKYAAHFPPRGEFLTLNWFGVANLPPSLNPFSLAAAHLPAWLFFTAYAPVVATAALLAMTLFLRELGLPRPAALVGGVIYAWQGDLLPFVFPGHYGYITTWPFFALAAWAALRGSPFHDSTAPGAPGAAPSSAPPGPMTRLRLIFIQASTAPFRRHDLAAALIAGASCGMMIGLQPDRGSIASLLIGALYLAPALFGRAPAAAQLRSFVLCAGTALLVSLASFLALFQSNIVGVKLGGANDRDQLFVLATQFSLHPAETFTYLAPGFFGWHNTHPTGPYWGWIGQAPSYAVNHQGARNLNLAISTIGTAGSLLALLGAALLLPGSQRFFGWTGSQRQSPANTSPHQVPSPQEPSPPPESGAGQPSAVPSSPREILAGKRGRILQWEETSASAAPAPRRPPRPLPPPAFGERPLFFGRLLLVLGLVALVLAWGYHTPLYRPLFALPLMDKWRNPLKWLEIFNFAAVTLAALGVAELVRSLSDATRRHALALFFAVAVGLLFVLLLASYPLAIAVAGFLAAEQYQPLEIADAMHNLHVALGFAFVIGVLLWLVAIGGWQGDRLQHWDIVNPWLRRQWQRALQPENRPATLAFCCTLLIAGQLAWVAAQFVTPTELANLTATNPLLDSLRSEGPLVRVAVPQPQDSLLNFYLQNQFAADRISSIDISAASRIPDALAAFVGAFSGHTERLWLLGGVKNAAIGQSELTTLRQDAELATNIAAADGYTLTATTDDQPTHALVRLRDYFDKATFIPGGEVVATDADLLARLVDPHWHPRDLVLLSRDGPGAVGAHDELTNSLLSAPPAASNPAPAVAVQVTRYSPHRIDLAVTAPAAGFVLLNDQFDSDWQAALDGKTVPLLRADYLLRAVAVPAGSSSLTFRYATHYRVAGLAIPAVLANDCSDASMLLAFLVGAFLLRRPKNSSPPRG